MSAVDIVLLGGTGLVGRWEGPPAEGVSLTREKEDVRGLLLPRSAAAWTGVMTLGDLTLSLNLGGREESGVAELVEGPPADMMVEKKGIEGNTESSRPKSQIEPLTELSKRPYSSQWSHQLIDSS